MTDFLKDMDNSALAALVNGVDVREQQNKRKRIPVRIMSLPMSCSCSCLPSFGVPRTAQENADVRTLALSATWLDVKKL